MEPSKLVGKRLMYQEEMELGPHKSPRSAAMSRSNEDDCASQKEQLSRISDCTQQPLRSLPDEVVCAIFSYLDVHSLLDMRCLNHSFRTLASKNSAGWSNLCRRLWETKIHVSPAAVSTTDSMAAYRMSIQDAANRNHVEPHEFLFDPETRTGTIWSFRFKEAAGTDWTSWDPWYQGQPCRKMVFLRNGTVKEYHLPEESDNASLNDPPFSERMGNMLDPPIPMSWRYVTRPLDMPARPEGSYIRFSVAGRDVPTYCVRRSPTKNWGFIMESCWGVYASFELPKRLPNIQTHMYLRLRRAQDALGNWFNVEVEDSDEEDQQGEEDIDDETLNRRRSQMLVDDRSFTVTSGLQWREALMYNYGARHLPEGEEALADFERIYSLLNTS